MSGHLTARDVMTAQVITVRPETTVKEAAALMLAHHVSGLPVVTVEGDLVGIVTEADLLYKETGRERAQSFFRRWARSGLTADVSRKVAGLTAIDLMSSPVVTVEEATPLHDVAALMVRRRINRVPVMRRGRLAGIVSRADVLRAFTRPDAEMARTVRTALLRELWVDVGRIEVAVRDGVVRLSGVVDRRSELDLVTRWVAGLDGVIGVENRLAFEYDDRAVALGASWPPDDV